MSTIRGGSDIIFHYEHTVLWREHMVAILIHLRHVGHLQEFTRDSMCILVSFDVEFLFTNVFVPDTLSSYHPGYCFKK